VVGKVKLDVAVHSAHHASAHDIVTWSMASRLKPVRQLVDYKFRSLKNVDWSSFQADVLGSELYATPIDNIDEFADKLDTVITEILDRHCPLQERRKHVSIRCDNYWLSKDAVDGKTKRRELERSWRSTLEVNDYERLPEVMFGRKKEHRCVT